MEKKSLRSSGFTGMPAKIFFIALVYFLSARLSLFFAFEHTNVSPVCPSAGIALAAVLLLGYRIWPAIAIGAFFADAWALSALGISMPAYVVASMVTAFGNTLAAVAGFFLIKYSIKDRSPFDNLMDALKFVLFGALISPLFSSVSGVTTLYLTKGNWSDCGFIWFTWWLGDITGVLVMTPLLLTWDKRKSIAWKPFKIAEAALLLSFLLSLAEISFVSGYSIRYLFVPLFVWAAISFGQFWSYCILFLLSVIAILSTINDMGPFVNVALDKSLLSLQGYICTISLLIIILTSLVKERSQAEKTLIKQSGILDTFFKHSITPLVILDRDFNFIRVNEAYAKACRRDVSEFPGHNHFEFYPSNNRVIFENVVRTKEPYQTLAKPFIFPDHPEWGTTYWDWTLTPILDNQNEVEFLVFSLKDVTEQKITDDNLLLFRELINSSNDAIYAVDPETSRILNVNNNACSSLGYDRNELMNMKIIDIEAIFPDNFSWDNHIKEVKNKGYMLLEGVNKRKDGTTFPVETSVRYVSHNEMNYIIGVVRDITERKKLEQEREQLYRFFQTSSDLMCMADPNGRFIKTNPACSELLGFSETELTSKPFIEFVHTDDRQSTLDEMARQLQRGFSINFENRYICKDGSSRWLSWRAIYNKDERITYAIARDFTDYKEAEKKLRLAISYNRSLIETSLDPLVTIDSAGKITDVNSATEKITGYLRNELIGSDFSDYFTEPEKARNGYQKVFRYGSVQDYALEIRHRDGHITPVFYNAAVYRNEKGEISGVFAAARDISARVQVENELQRLNKELEERVRNRTTALEKLANNIRENQKALLNVVDDLNLSKKELEEANAKLKELDIMKSMFIASMSHELRTPLNSIIGFSSILGNEWIGTVNPEQKEKLATILRAGKHLLNLINDVIDVSKIEAGKIGSSTNDFDLYELISEATEFFKSDIDKKGLNFEVHSIHRTMHTDRRRLLQCMINLISNAVKFTPKGSISIKTQLSHTDGASSDSVEIIVADTGIGIKEEDIQKLFFPFVRIHTPLSSTIPGTGLGLYLSKKIAVEILKGDITVKSKYNDGSIFTLKAPVTL